MDAKVPPLGWLDVTDVVIQITGIQLGVDTVATYNFYSDLSKEPIAIVTMDNNQAFATQIMFKNTATVVDGLDEVNTAKPLAIVSPTLSATRRLLASQTLRLAATGWQFLMKLAGWPWKRLYR